MGVRIEKWLLILRLLAYGLMMNNLTNDANCCMEILKKRKKVSFDSKIVVEDGWKFDNKWQITLYSAAPILDPIYLQIINQFFCDNHKPCWTICIALRWTL
jgi:hypothetical protein